MKNREHYLAIVIFIFASFSGTLFAQETAYVTDSLRLRVHAQSNDSSDILTIIESGDSVEVLENQGAFSQVRTLDGSTGWVKSAFLVKQPPAKLLYYSASEQNKQLEEQIQALQNSTVTTTNTDRKQITKLERDLHKQQQANQELQEQTALLKQESQQLDSLPSNIAVTNSSAAINTENIFLKHKHMVAALAAILLLFGLLLGIKFSSWRMRKRLHGFSLE